MAKDKTSMKQKVEKEKSLLYVLIGSHRNKEYSCVAWLPSLVFPSFLSLSTNVVLWCQCPSEFY